VQAPAASSAAVAILLCKDAEHLQLPSDVLADDAEAREGPVLRLCRLGPLSTTGFFLRGLAVTGPFLDALIAFSRSPLYLFCYGELAPLA
jgi:hypothetical protein